MEEKKENENCISNIENTLSPHIGKFGLGLSIMGGIVSVLLGFKIIIPASIIMGLTNAGIFAGSLAFERLQQQKEKLNDDCESQRQIIRKLTIKPFFDNYNNGQNAQQEEDIQIETETETGRSIDTIEPINFEQMHKNNILQSSLNNFTFPKK